MGNIVDPAAGPWAAAGAILISAALDLRKRDFVGFSYLDQKRLLGVPPDPEGYFQEQQG